MGTGSEMRLSPTNSRARHRFASSLLPLRHQMPLATLSNCNDDNVHASCTYTAIPSQFSHFVPVESKICLHCKTLLFCDGEGYSCFFQQLLATLYAKSGDLSLQQMFSLPTTDCTPVLPHIPHFPAGGPW